MGEKRKSVFFTRGYVCIRQTINISKLFSFLSLFLRDFSTLLESRLGNAMYFLSLLKSKEEFNCSNKLFTQPRHPHAVGAFQVTKKNGTGGLSPPPFGNLVFTVSWVSRLGHTVKAMSWEWDYHPPTPPTPTPYGAKKTMKKRKILRCEKELPARLARNLSLPAPSLPPDPQWSSF